MPEIGTERSIAIDAAETQAPTVGLPPVPEAPIDSLVEDELVEDISIDGMCGVY